MSAFVTGATFSTGKNGHKDASAALSGRKPLKRRWSRAGYRSTPALLMRVKAASIHSSTATDPSPITDGSVDRWVVFLLDQGRYALPLDAVSRIVRAAEITPLPRAPRAVLGALDVAGQVLPVFDLRGRFGLPERAIEAGDYFLIATSRRRSVVLPIDSAMGVFDCPANSAIEAALIAPELELVSGVIQLPDGLALIHDLEMFLSADESRALDDALTRDGAHAD